MSGFGQWVLRGMAMLGLGLVCLSGPHPTAINSFAKERAIAGIPATGSATRPSRLNQNAYSPSVSTPYEMVLFEAPWCLYCLLFKEDVAPLYQRQQWSAKPKFRRVDFFSEGSAGYALKHTIQALPTIVIFKNGREIGRVTGMTGAEEFIHLARHIIDRPS